MTRRFHLLTAAFAALVATAAAPSVAQEYKIGDVNSYKSQPQHLEHYRRGMQLALDEINGAGGVNGRKLAVVTRDDNGNPGEAVRAAEELVSREKVDALSGSFLSSVALALNDFSRQKKVFFLATMSLSDRMIWQEGQRYGFRLRAGTYTQTAMLAAEAAKLKKKRWALVYPNYEFGQSAAATFKQMLKAVQPDVEFVAEQAPALGKIDAGSVVQALDDAKPDAIFNVLFSADLIKFVRAGNTRGLFEKRSVLSLVTGEPENLDPLKEDTPQGWIVTGYPWQSVRTPEHDAFFKAYQARFGDYPRISSIMGYNTVRSIAEGLRKAGSSDQDKLVAAFKGLRVATPWGPITYRPEDNQSTLGSFIGVTRLVDGKGVMTEGRYADGLEYQPPLADVLKLRKPE
ncbi:MAG: ABC transporter substrate-binding protein [Burkholderiaceae bacterium]